MIPKNEHTSTLKGMKWVKRKALDTAKNTGTVFKAIGKLPPHLHQKITTTDAVIWIDPWCGQKRHTARAGDVLATVADPDDVEAEVSSVGNREVVEADSPSSPSSSSHGVDDDIQFLTIVNMFVQPAAFLSMTGHAEEEIMAFNDMKDKTKEQFLEQVFARHIAPTLPDRVLKGEQILLGGETYTLRRTAGVGGFGVIHQYVSDHGRPIAIKAQKKPDFRAAIDELRNHFHAQGKTFKSAARGIAPLLGVLWTEHGLLFALDYLPGGDYQQLEAKLARAIREGIITDAKLLAAIHVTVLRDAAKGLAKANANHVLHDDMHNRNLIFKEGKGWVCDFGCSQVFDDAQVDSTTFNRDAIRLGHLVRNDHSGFDHERPEVFENDTDESGSPAALLEQARPFFKENGAGGPHARAVIDALTAWDGEDNARLIATRDAYLDASHAVNSGGANWRDMKSMFQGNQV